MLRFTFETWSTVQVLLFFSHHRLLNQIRLHTVSALAHVSLLRKVWRCLGDGGSDVLQIQQYPPTSTIPMISRICPTSCSEILVWISSEVHQLCGFCPTGVREADCSSRLLWSAPVHLWDVVDSSSPAFLLSSPAPKSNPSAHSKCTCSCLPFTQGLEVLGGWGIRCSPDPTVSTHQYNSNDL